MNFKRPVFAAFFATFFIAACALSTPANAQNTQNNVLSYGSSSARGPVVTTEQVRAELLAWAPEGVEAGKP
ncbi:MAG: hypothetical protein ACREXG_08975, partial [Polaromonas sp.]